jgi:hypothetical protein
VPKRDRALECDRPMERERDAERASIRKEGSARTEGRRGTISSFSLLTNRRYDFVSFFFLFLSMKFTVLRAAVSEIFSLVRIYFLYISSTILSISLMFVRFILVHPLCRLANTNAYSDSRILKMRYSFALHMSMS